MVVAEALGEMEEKEGRALVGKSGFTLFEKLAQVGIQRDGLTLFNCVACRPPNNKLVGMPWEREAIAHCAPNLDAAIAVAAEKAQTNGKTFVIVTLGVTAFKRVMGLDHKKDAALLKADYGAYPHWSDRYNCWVLSADHPAYLLRGNTELWPVVQWVFQRAQEIANGGLTLEEHDYVLDPDAEVFEIWASGYFSSLYDNPENPLSYDIETPYKRKKGEDELEKEEDADHSILRVSFSYLDGDRTNTCSVRWTAEYFSTIYSLFAKAPVVLGWNSDNYDFPKVSHHCKINGLNLDGMVAWHILHSALPKGLGFVTPFYVQNTLMWKHLSDTQPAYYNAKDADMALRNYIGIKRDLERNRLWHVFERHVLEVNKALRYMSGKGVLRDEVARQEAEEKLSAILANIERQMQEAVPEAAKKQKIAKKQPKDLTEWTERIIDTPQDYCSACGVKAPKRWKKHATICGGPTCQLPMPTTVWTKPLPFKISKLGMMNYQKELAHRAIVNRKEGKVTFDEDAIVRLMKDYPHDPLYPLILTHRKAQKLLATYVGVTENGKIRGGMPVGEDGRIHTTYTHNPSTLRFASEDPNLQNLPRPSKNPDDLVNIIRNLVVAGPGNILYARDYSGIEAVLTGYFAGDPKYIRIAKRDVHTFYTVHALYELEGGARIKAADLPDLDWPDERLFPYLEELKKEFSKERNSLYKHLVHAANFMQSAKGAQAKIFSETRIEYPVQTVQKVMDVYYSLFPKIKQWHRSVLDEAQKEGYLRNPFGYVHHFSRAYEWKKEYGEWIKKPGADANRVISFKPQSTAAAIIKEAILRLFFNRFDEAGQFLRLQIHDELFFEIPRDQWQAVDLVVLEEMERPVPELRCPDSWGFGPCLQVLTEAKMDLNEPSRWGRMK